MFCPFKTCNCEFWRYRFSFEILQTIYKNVKQSSGKILEKRRVSRVYVALTRQILFDSFSSKERRIIGGPIRGYRGLIARSNINLGRTRNRHIRNGSRQRPRKKGSERKGSRQGPNDRHSGMADTVEPREDRGESKSRKKNQGHSVLASNQETRRTGLPLREMRLIFFPVLLPFFPPLLFFPFFPLFAFFPSLSFFSLVPTFAQSLSFHASSLSSPSRSTFRPLFSSHGDACRCPVGDWPKILAVSPDFRLPCRCRTSRWYRGGTSLASYHAILSILYYGKGGVNWKE